MHFQTKVFEVKVCFFVFNYPSITIYSYIGTDPFGRLEKPGIEPASHGLQGERFIYYMFLVFKTDN